MIQVVLSAREQSGGHNLKWLWSRVGGSARLREGRRLTVTGKLGLEGCNLCCQLVDVLFSGHAVLAQGLWG